ncbi:unnamed protein product [Schistocephalus solidus]|uniref:Uncharacterized protein n=1 Tax=Schistocephalus solidus TaxID=70667 RepID=A0A183SIL9_SCHSO|nr:unnamed protein product [Schistocephalus solidus]
MEPHCGYSGIPNSIRVGGHEPDMLTGQQMQHFTGTGSTEEVTQEQVNNRCELFPVAPPGFWNTSGVRLRLLAENGSLNHPLHSKSHSPPTNVNLLTTQSKCLENLKSYPFGSPDLQPLQRVASSPIASSHSLYIHHAQNNSYETTQVTGQILLPTTAKNEVPNSEGTECEQRMEADFLILEKVKHHLLSKFTTTSSAPSAEEVNPDALRPTSTPMHYALERSHSPFNSMAPTMSTANSLLDQRHHTVIGKVLFNIL